MVRSDAQSLATRLLELQQRFESYVVLHEEELKEIKAILRQMRQDVLLLNQPLESGESGSDQSNLAPQDEAETPVEDKEIPPLLTL